MVTETGSWRVPIVFDNLIHKGEMPVTIGIFIDPGVLPAASPDQQNRYNRSYEYDALGDRYARFLIEEILPEVAKHYSLSKDPNDYAIAGSSSGGIAAFNAAWNRPDVFRRVAQLRRQLHESARWRHAGFDDSQDRAQAAPRLSAGRTQRSGYLLRELVPRQPGNLFRAAVRRL